MKCQLYAAKLISKKNSISTLLKILDQKGLIKKKYYIKVTKNGCATFPIVSDPLVTHSDITFSTNFHLP